MSTFSLWPFLIIRASKLERTSSFQGGYIVLFERARPEEIFPLIMEAYSFTIREKQVIRKILTGMSTKRISPRTLYIYIHGTRSFKIHF